MRTAAKKTAVAPPIVDDVLRSPGRPLDPATRDAMEARLGHDFRDVRVHADATSAESAAAVGAKAYTVGRDVVFGANRFAPHTGTGERLLAHELTHVIQQRNARRVSSEPIPIGDVDTPHEHEADAHSVSTTIVSPLVQRQPVTTPLPQTQTTPPPPQRLPCAQTGTTAPTLPGGCIAREPENCATYEQWLMSFENMATSTDVFTGHSYLGHQAATATEPATPRVGEQPRDAFIDHPTDQWVRDCLPENLRQTAYMLPSDCADVAVILRHVWLAAHHRTEQHPLWLLGDTTGAARQRDVGRDLNVISSWNVGGMLNPYSDSGGHPLTTFAALENLLHPGDVMVWRHHNASGGATGGHTHTIVHVERSGGHIVRLDMLQGNLPIDASAAAAIRTAHPTAPTAAVLQDAPGRRVETDSMSTTPSPDRTYGTGSRARTVWMWDDGSTTLEAAGPPASAPRPAAGLVGGRRTRQISDWTSSLAGATSRTVLYARFEAMLLELRSLVESGQTGLDTAATALVQAAGHTLGRLRTSATDPEHTPAVQRMSGLISALANPAGAAIATATPLQTLFATLQTAFVTAANEITH